MSNATVAHYEILAQIGAGGMGEVYRARDTLLDREVALKLLPREVAESPERRERFLREARAASALNHPNVCTIHAVGETADGRPFMAMELLEGQTLQQTIQGGPLEAVRILEVGIQVADALETAHAKSIVHRDIKPSNIMITARGWVKVLDFGLAKRVHPEISTDRNAPTEYQTQVGQVLGTMHYMSPEQALGEAVDARTDIFSFGAVLYEMATGRPAFSGSSFGQIVQQIVHVHPPAVSRFNYNLPPELERIIRRCLEKERERRYQSSRDLLIDLQNLKRDHGAPASQVRAASAEAIPDGPSVAVLPFTNITSDPENEHFADGITEDLIVALSRIKGLHVPAPTSAFAFKGRNDDIRKIGQLLNVKTVLEGSVRRSGSRLRIAAQLISVADGYHLWADRYDREVQDVFTIQDEITHAIVEALRVRLLPEEQKVLAPNHPENTKAHHHYLEGRRLLSQWGTGVEKAVHHFHLAILEDPLFAPAHVGLADAQVSLGVYGVVPPAEAFAKAEASVRQALRLDADLAEAHATLGYISFIHDWNPTAAETWLARAIELSPRTVSARYWRAVLHAALGDARRCLAEVDAARSVDPVSDMVNAQRGWMLLYLGRSAEAIQHLRESLRAAPEHPLGQWVLGLALVDEGQYADGLEALQLAIGGAGALPYFRARLGAAYGLAGETAKALELLREIEAGGAADYVSSYGIALIHCGLNNLEAALARLETSLEERHPGLALAHVDPMLKRLRRSPRFRELTREVGIFRE